MGALTRYLTMAPTGLVPSCPSRSALSRPMRLPVLSRRPPSLCTLRPPLVAPVTPVALPVVSASASTDRQRQRLRLPPAPAWSASASANANACTPRQRQRQSLCLRLRQRQRRQQLTPPPPSLSQILPWKGGRCGGGGCERPAARPSLPSSSLHCSTCCCVGGGGRREV
ncbi:unnamed protein product [Closterium sp. NIES-53]